VTSVRIQPLTQEIVLGSDGAVLANDEPCDFSHGLMTCSGGDLTENVHQAVTRQDGSPTTKLIPNCERP
jgi:hypothetical protein